ncbi:protein FAM114A2 [Antennarius striatus]|uniref:protein FAM114A2 n=1 Tax=Antennarius striatus TaxID=241820 RepID=UPI0035B3916A
MSESTAVGAGPPDGPSPPSPESSPDVAPTRRARRRPDPPTGVEEQRAEPPTSSLAPAGWGSWGNWGKSILSTASATAATVGQGLSQVIEKAESSLGIPTPTELSAQVGQEQVEGAEASDGPPAVGGAMGMLTSLSSVVQSTGRTVITGGLDALEFIGKKTMDAIAEGDPGFRRTKGLMVRHATLSQVLREAKEREELQKAEEEESEVEPKAVAHYGMFFDEFQGLSHLEALEILSRESEAKVRSVLTTLSGDQQVRLRAELQLLQDSFSLVDFDEEEVEKKGEGSSDFEGGLTAALEGLGAGAPCDGLVQAWRDACSQITALTTPQGEEAGASVEEVHGAAIRALAQLTARSIQMFHKLAENILSARGGVQAHALSQLTVVLCREMSLLSKKFTSCLTTRGANEKGDVLNPLITGVFLEASNSASYIQDAFQLLMPILQVSHIQQEQ